jgi:hypothetical protein
MAHISHFILPSDSNKSKQFNAICSNPKHTGKFTEYLGAVYHGSHFRESVAPKFNIKEDYKKWYVTKYNCEPSLPYAELKNTWSEESKAFHIGNDEWLCETCFTYICFKCCKHIGGEKHLNYCIDTNRMIHSIALHVLNRLPFIPVGDIIPTKENGYIFGGRNMHVLAQQTSSANGASCHVQFYLGQLASNSFKHIAMHNVFMNVNTFDPDIKKKINVNICNDCYDADPREIYIMKEQINKNNSLNETIYDSYKQLQKKYSELFENRNKLFDENYKLKHEIEKLTDTNKNNVSKYNKLKNNYKQDIDDYKNLASKCDVLEEQIEENKNDVSKHDILLEKNEQLEKEINNYITDMKEIHMTSVKKDEIIETLIQQLSDKQLKDKPELEQHIELEKIDLELDVKTVNQLNMLIKFKGSFKDSITQIVKEHYSTILSELNKMKTTYNNLLSLKNDGIICDDNIIGSINSLKHKIDAYEDFCC